MEKTDKEKLAEALAQLEALKAQQTSRISFKVSQARKAGTNGPEDKGSSGGAVSLYGLGRFPVTLYASQWESLIQVVPQLKQFLNANKGQLATKPAVGPTANGPVIQLRK